MDTMKLYVTMDEQGVLQTMYADKTIKELYMTFGLKFFDTWDAAQKYRDYIF